MTDTSIKVDRTKCYTPKNYAKKFSIPLSTVYYQIKQNDIKTVKIDGVVFIYKE